MDFDVRDLSCEGFASELAARKPVPGGGAAAAYVGALASSLASMVGEFTVGKPRYAAVEDDVLAIMSRAAGLREELLSLSADDARAYALVSAAYGLAKDDPERPGRIQEALKEAAVPPLQVMRACGEVLGLLEELEAKGSKLLQADVACGALMASSALEAASLSIWANTVPMRDRTLAVELESEADALLDTWRPRARAVADSVAKKSRGV